VLCFRTVIAVQEVIITGKGGIISFRVQLVAVRAFLLVCVVLLSIHTLACAQNLSVPVLLVHGFQIGAINPLALSAGQFDLRNTWKTMVDGLVGERHCTFVPIPVMDLRGQRLWTFWKARNHPIYISNYTENARIPSLTCIGTYAALLANEIQEVQRREGVNKIDIVSHSMGGLVSRAYIERGNKCLCSLWDKFWVEVCAQIGIEIPPHAYCALFEEHHGCGDNDLVVATESVKLSEIPPQRYIVYPLDHDSLYRDAEVIRKVRTLLL